MPKEIVEIRGRLDAIEKLLAQLASELKAIREELHAAATAEGTGHPPNRRESA